jgi:polysaccharide deacetylase 2 family uncharacterized protein YibQ
MAVKRKKRKKTSRKKTNNRKNLYTFLFVIFILFILYFLVHHRANMSVDYMTKARNLFKQDTKPQGSVEDAILHSIKLLGVPSRHHDKKIKDDAIYFYVGINKTEMDLNYANMIITGQIELSGGETISGKETDKGTKQILEFMDPIFSQKYIVTLYFAKYSDKYKKETLLAIILDDFGYFKNELLDDFCNLDPNITFAILPGISYSKIVMQKAAEKGHETMIHMPMEPLNYPRNNPGENAIYVHMTEREIRKTVQGYIKQLPLCEGANNHMGSLVTADKDIMAVVLSELKKKDLYFIDSRTSQSSIAYSLAREMMIPTLENNLFLDTPSMSDETLRNKVNQLKNMKKKKSRIVIISHCSTRKHYNYLKKFLKEIENLDFELVPVSRLFEKKIPEII